MIYDIFEIQKLTFHSISNIKIGFKVPTITIKYNGKRHYVSFEGYITKNYEEVFVQKINLAVIPVKIKDKYKFFKRFKLLDNHYYQSKQHYLCYVSSEELLVLFHNEYFDVPLINIINQTYKENKEEFIKHIPREDEEDGYLDYTNVLKNYFPDINYRYMLRIKPQED